MKKKRPLLPYAYTGAGLFFSIHFSWSLLVALRLAQPILDWIYWFHFIKPIFIVETFELSRAVVLLAVTSAVGFCLGMLYGLIRPHIGASD